MSLTSFLNNFKSSKVKTKLLDGKEAEFYRIFSDVTDLKIRPSWHNALISKSGQMKKKNGILLFFKLFSGLNIWKCPYNYQMNGLNPNMIHHINASELWNAFISYICDFDNHVWFCRHLKRSKVIKLVFFCNLWPFLRRSHHSWSWESYICDIDAFHNSLAFIWGIALEFKPFFWTFSDSKSRK